MKFRPIVHPVFMAAFPALFLFATNVREAQLLDTAIPLLVSIAIALAVWGILTPIFRNAKAAGLATTLFLVMFASYGHVSKFIDGFSIGSFVWGRNKFLLPLWVVFFVLGIYGILWAKKNQRLSEWTFRGNVFATILVAISIVQILTFQFERGFSYRQDKQDSFGVLWPRATALAPKASVPTDSLRPSLPDIYYIIPDSYEASSSLQEVFGYDNSPFTDYLESKGFFIASESRSNYTFTSLSLTSSLNMQHLDFLTEKMGSGSSDISLINRMMRNNKVMEFLKAEGYTVINAGSWWGPTYAGRYADINLRASRLNDFTLKLLQGTILAPFMEEFTEDDLRNKVLFTFKNLEAIPFMEAPTFTLAHIICPHPPFIFGPDGKRVPTLRRVLAKSDPRSLYRDQVIFVNTKLRETVDHILHNSKTPPIIIIQGDHGAAYTHRVHPRAGVLPDDRYLREQMGIFNAYYLPGVDKKIIPDSITPVNTFRVIFNIYFNQNLPMLDNQSLYSTRDRPFSFTNVTERIINR